MKILSVRFQNLNSLKGEHEIRFDQSPLVDAGLFAITGPTGAGKTTILDAITVGLYGMAHRHKRTTVSELMTRHTGECYSEVEFESNGKCYRSKWSLHRSYKKPTGELQNPNMELAEVTTGEIIESGKSLVPPKVAELCGLDYDQFLRSVMLSQGDFARFLKAEPRERSSLLEKITDTGIYTEISRFAYRKASTEQAKKIDIERRLQDSKLLPEEQKLAYETTIAEYSQTEIKLNQYVNQLQEKRQWLVQVQQLRQRTEQYRTVLQAQEEKLVTLQPDFHKLQQHEQANQFVGELTQIKATNSHLTEVQLQLATLEKQIPVLEAELEQTSRAALASTQAHHQQEEVLQNLEPLLAQVQQLDHQLHTVRELFRTGKEEYIQLDTTFKQEQTAHAQKEKELSELSQKEGDLKKWLTDNARLKDLRENLHEFRQMVKDLNDTSQAIATLQQEQQTIKQQLQTDALQLATIQEAQHEQQQKQTILEGERQEKLAKQQTILANKSFDELDKLVKEQPQIVLQYGRLLELSQNYSLQQQKAEQITGHLAQLQLTINDKSIALTEQQQKQTIATEKLNDLQQLVMLQQRIQELEQHRHTLQPEQPCPLCGSEHHPFVEGNYTSTLSEEEQRRDAQLAFVKEVDESAKSLQLQLNTLQAQLENTNQAATENKAELQRLQQSYTQHAHGVTIAITDVAQLQQLHQAQREMQGSLEQALEEVRQVSREIETITQELQQLREVRLQAQAQISKLQHSEEILNKQLLSYSSKIQDLQEQLQAFTETAQSFAANYGLVYTSEKRYDLLQHLEAQNTTYQQQYDAAEALREPVVTLQEQVKNLKLNLTERDRTLKAKKTGLGKIHEQLTALKEERTQLFGDKNTQQEREAARQELSNRAKLAEEARAAHQQKQQELQDQRHRQQECTATHTLKKSELDNLCNGLLQVLQQKGIETIESLSQMLLHRDEADRLANLKAQTEKQLTELRKSLSDVQTDLATEEVKSLTTETIDALQQQLATKTTDLHELIADRAKLQQLLEQDKQQREKNLELAKQLEIQLNECNRWNQLSDLIGSADGNKFSRFAQGLTLARLVELANRHLHKLNDRYKILKSSGEDLELLIVDTYQAEAVRPMNTLSGGESFLVSLALALGLSDLAGRRTQINSLFIDEGFGTLDADTLDSAISTLENLQASGKMIGIISHVEALKERISTQVKIQKLHGGVSKIEVVGW
jgi:DNA repair protein SbcC/Rad50